MLMRRADPPGRAAPASWAGVTLALTVTGYVLHYWTWMLIGPMGPQLGYRFGLDAGTWALLGIVPLVVGVLVRVPAGMLADRFGARIVLPVVSVVAAIGVAALTVADGLAALIAVACTIGVAGAGLPAAAAAVVRAVAPGRRASALSLFAAGMCLAAATGVAVRATVAIDRGHGLLILACALLGHAGLSAVVLRDRPTAGQRPAGAWSAVAALVRRPATRHLTIWYGVSCGGLVALDVYLPEYLHNTFGVGWTAAMLGAAAAVGLGAMAGSFGGWLCRRRAPTAVIGVCFTALAALLLVLAFEPPLAWVAGPVLGGVAVALGTAFGSVLALIGRTAPPAHAGTITGVIGAAGSGVGLFPPLLLNTMHDLNGSYTIGLILLATAAVCGAGSLRARRAWIGAAVAFPAPAAVASPADAASQAATTIVSLDGPQVRAYFGDATAVLAALATRHEVAVVCRDGGTGLGFQLVAGLRRHLPAHTVLAITAETPPHPHETAAIAEMIDAGTIPLVLVDDVDPTPTALLLAAAVDADQVLQLGLDRVEGLIPFQRLPTTHLPLVGG
ncbi:nitrate/nitrite transporter [Dactylosporangium sp. NPDC000521]|uniref:MFS transporter n=1 Tax=Dactylosporangium sp. NPDC000521 TaxID=3363975 RepID=UPI0036778309